MWDKRSSFLGLEEQCYFAICYLKDRSNSFLQDQLDAETVAPKSLSESYSLHDEGKPEISIKGEGADAVAAFSSNKEVI